MAKPSAASSRAKKPTPPPGTTAPVRQKPAAVTTPKPTPSQSLANRLQYGLFLLSLLTPVVFSTTVFFGFTSVRVLYFEAVVTLMTIVSVWQKPVWINRFSWVQAAVLLFLIVMTIANALGIDTQSSFWSGFARMEGFVTYVYLGLYLLIIARSGFSAWQWTTALSIWMSIAVMVVIGSYFSMAGWQVGDRRLMGPVGNPTFLAVYLLQQLFLIGLLALRTGRKSNVSGNWAVLATLIIAGVILLTGLVLTGSRSAIVGLSAGGITLALLLGIRYARTQPKLTGLVLGSLVMLLAIGWFVAHTEVLQHQPIIYRLTHLSGSLNTWKPRQMSSQIAMSAIAEHPVLGWGQDNYNYGFARHYIPALVQEGIDWYDRVHNVPLEWAFSGGLVGLLAYLLVWIAGLVQLRRSGLSVVQKQVLLAGFVAYFVFNLFNPDSVLALQGFFLLLGFVDTTPEGTGNPSTTAINSSGKTSVPLWIRAAQALIISGLLGLTYFALFVSITTLHQLNRQKILPTLSERVSVLEQTYRSAMVGKIDVADQLVTLALSALNDPSVSAADKQTGYDYAVSAWSEVCRQHPQSSRYEVRLASLHVARDQYAQAFWLYQDAVAKEKGQRPALFVQIGSAYMQQGNVPAALTAFRKAHQLEPRWETPVAYQAIAYVVGHQPDRADSLLHQLSDAGLVANISLVKQAYYMARNPDGLVKRINKVAYKHQFSPEVYIEWTTAAFDAHDANGLEMSLNAFARHYGARYDYSIIKQLMDDAIHRNLSPVDGLRQLVAQLS